MTTVSPAHTLATDEPSPIRGDTAVSARSSYRNPAIDAARLVCFVAIVMIHVADRSHFIDPNSLEAAQLRLSIDAGQVIDQLARFGVPFFFVSSGYFLARRRNADVTQSLRSIFGRIVPVYLFWLLVFNVPNAAARQSVLDPGFLVRLLLNGGVAEHLWYLPAMALCLTLMVLGRRFLGSTALVAALALGLYAIGLLLGSYHSTVTGVEPSLLQSHIARDFCFGLIFVVAGGWLAQTDWRPTFTIACALFVGGAVFSLLEGLALTQLGRHPLYMNDSILGTLPYGVGAFLIALTWPSRWQVPAALAGLGVFGLGLYAVHPIAIDALAYLHRPTNMAERFVLALLATVLSAAVVLLLSRWNRLRRFIA